MSPARTLPALLVSLALAVVTSAGASAEPSPTPSPAPTTTPTAPGERWVAGTPYTGGFPDPTVMVDGGTYVASATTAANLNLPIMTSTDLRTWTPRPALPDALTYSTWRLYNEAMVVKPAWAATRMVRDKVELISQWAPSIAKLQGRYVAAFSAAVTLEPRKSCIGVATAPTALGMYVPTSPAPLACYDASALGAIDPDIFVDPRTRTPWLLWKNEGRIGTHGPRLMARKLNPSGTGFAPRSKNRVLMTTTQGWEAGIVENPSMVRYRGTYYLIYSGGRWENSSYATGYAVCRRGPMGPCKKPVKAPILASGNGVEGPGGADAFVDLQGRLRFVYAAWDTGRVGVQAGRKLHVGALAPVARGKRLVVTER